MTLRLRRILPIALLALLLAPGAQLPAQSAEPAPPDTTAARPRHSVVPLPSLFYTPETGWAGGGAVLHVYRHDVRDAVRRPTTSEVSAIFTQREQIVASVGTDYFSAGNRYRWSASFAYVHFPDVFYGIGRDLPVAAGESYTLRRASLAAGMRRRFRNDVFVGAAYGYHDLAVGEVKPDGLLAAGRVTGSAGGVASGLSVAFGVDTREHVLAPRGGTYAEFRVRRSAAWLGSDFEFDTYSIDARHFAPTAYGQVLAVHAAVNATAGDAPFQLLPRLGGSQLMRGYNPNRNRDRHLAAVQAEYRVPLWWRLGAVAFVGAGDVAGELDELLDRAPQLSYGIGGRFLARPRERLNLRADLAFTTGRPRLYLAVGEAF